jgi:L-fucose isomerase-like protein
MENIKIGFVPSHRYPFDEEWASQMRQRCLEALSKIDGLEIVCPDDKLTNNGFIRDDTDAAKAIQLFNEKNIDGLIIGTMTFGDEVSALKIAAAFAGLPILLFGTKEGPFKPDGGRRSDSFCGTLSISSGLHRRKIPFVFTGIVFPEEDTFSAGIYNFVRTCSIEKGFIGAQIGMVGPRPERFETCIANENAMIKNFNQRVVPVSLLDIVHRVDALRDDDSEVKKIIAEMRQQADLSAANEAIVLKFAKLECVLKQFCQDNSLSGLAIQCWTAMQEVYGISSCYVMGRLTDQGIMSACEVDIYGTLTMLVQHLSTLGKIPPHFIDWTIQHQEKPDMLLAWHCGNAPPSLVCSGCRVSIQSHSIFGEPLGLENCLGTAEFPLKPGEVTICRLVEYDEVFKMLITKGEIINADQNLRGSWSWVKVNNLDILYRTLVEEGFLHHASLIHGDQTCAINDACTFLGIETVIV